MANSIPFGIPDVNNLGIFDQSAAEQIDTCAPSKVALTTLLNKVDNLPTRAQVDTCLSNKVDNFLAQAQFYTFSVEVTDQATPEMFTLHPPALRSQPCQRHNDKMIDPIRKRRIFVKSSKEPSS